MVRWVQYENQTLTLLVCKIWVGVVAGLDMIHECEVSLGEDSCVAMADDGFEVSALKGEEFRDTVLGVGDAVAVAVLEPELSRL